MYICSHGSKRVGVLICLRRVIVSSMLPYSCLQLSICSAYAERGSLFLMYRVCSRNLDFKFLLVCPTYSVPNRISRVGSGDIVRRVPSPLGSWPVRGTFVLKSECLQILKTLMKDLSS